MIKKAILFIYLAFLIALAFISIFFVWINNSFLILCIEAVTDLIIISGVILYARKVHYKLWTFIFAVFIVFQIFLFAEEHFTELIDYILWIIILAPALYMNADVSGLFSRRIVFKKNIHQTIPPNR